MWNLEIVQGDHCIPRGGQRFTTAICQLRPGAQRDVAPQCPHAAGDMLPWHAVPRYCAYHDPYSNNRRTNTATYSKPVYFSGDRPCAEPAALNGSLWGLS